MYEQNKFILVQLKITSEVSLFSEKCSLQFIRINGFSKMRYLQNNFKKFYTFFNYSVLHHFKCFFEIHKKEVLPYILILPPGGTHPGKVPLPGQQDGGLLLVPEGALVLAVGGLVQQSLQHVQGLQVHVLGVEGLQSFDGEFHGAQVLIAGGEAVQPGQWFPEWIINICLSHFDVIVQFSVFFFKIYIYIILKLLLNLMFRSLNRMRCSRFSECRCANVMHKWGLKD